MEEYRMQVRYEINETMFSNIPGNPIAYWGNDAVFAAFRNNLLSDYVDCKSGIMTGNERFIEYWFEPSLTRIKFNCVSSLDMKGYKWFPLNSGGNFRKWYGNLEKVVDLENNGENIQKHSKNYRLRDSSYYFKNGITWGRITSAKIAFRTVKEGTLFGDAGPIGFVDDKKDYVLPFLTTKVVCKLLEFINPTLNFQVGDVMRLPLLVSIEDEENIKKLSKTNINISKSDWDSFETSWDFKKHPLI